jgi:protein phosphatase
MNDQAHTQFLPPTAGESSAVPARLPGASSAALPALEAAPGLRLRMAVLSDLGQTRNHQEDAAGAFAPAEAALTRGQLYVVADGMGGHRAGDVASQLALAEIQRSYYAAAGDDPAAALRQAFADASRAVRDHAAAASAHHGMGTTAVAAALRGRQLTVASIGDSRAYLIHAGQISQLTVDHTWAAGLLRSGALTPEQARHHPRRHVLTRALGSDAAVEPDLTRVSFVPGDALVLCTDGLTNYVADDEILAIAGNEAPSRAARHLVDLANDRGGADNITLIIVHAEPATAPKAGSAPGWRASLRPWVSRLSHALRALSLWRVIAAVLAVLLVLALLIAVLLSRSSAPERVILPAAPMIWPAARQVLVF